MNIIKPLITLITFTGVLTACNPNIIHSGRDIDKPEENSRLSIWPQIESEVARDETVETKVEQLLAKMTLEQKVAQMIQPEIRDITVEDMRRYGFGSYLNGGGAFPNNNKHSTPQDWIALAEAMYQASIDDSLDGIAIPTMWGTDAVHGHNNVIGATLFPHNIGLGATNNPELIEKIAQVTATEVMVTGIDWVFAPTVATVRDDRWGRTYEGYSEDPEIVKAYASSIVKGLQGRADQDFLSDNRVISTVKHFIGDGGTIDGDDQGNNIVSEQALYDIHAQGYVGGLTAGAQSVMASFNSWQGNKVHGSQYLLTNVLKQRMGFDGFVVGDWNGHGQIPGCTNDNCPQAINAGLDIYMVPTDAWKPLMENTIEQVNTGVIPLARINDAVRRILRVKFRAYLFDKPSPAKRKFSGKTALIGNDEHRKVARQAVRESLVLLKNKNNILPLSPKLNVLIAGDAADNIGKQSGGWTITWQGTNNTNEDFPGGSSILSGFQQQVEDAGGNIQFDANGQYTEKPDVAIVVFGEEPYAEGHGDRANLAYQRGTKTDLALLNKLKADGIPVISVFISGRPMWVNAELNASDAFVAAWLPGSEGKAIASVLLTDEQGKAQYDFKGKLSYSWPKTPDQIVNRGDEDYQPLFPYGFGLNYGDQNVLPDNLPETVSVKTNKKQRLVLFNGQVQKPWQWLLVDGNKRATIEASTLNLANVSYRTVDRHVQEDAIQLSFSGKEAASLALISGNGFREDLSGQLEQNASLVFAVKPITQVKELSIAMRCEASVDSCEANVSITEQLQLIPEGQWGELAVDLNCFAQQGMQFNKVVTVFELISSDLLTLSLSDIRFEEAPEMANKISCD